MGVMSETQNMPMSPLHNRETVRGSFYGDHEASFKIMGREETQRNFDTYSGSKIRQAMDSIWPTNAQARKDYREAALAVWGRKLYIKNTPQENLHAEVKKRVEEGISVQEAEKRTLHWLEAENSLVDDLSGGLLSPVKPITNDEKNAMAAHLAESNGPNSQEESKAQFEKAAGMVEQGRAEGLQDIVNYWEDVVRVRAQMINEGKNVRTDEGRKEAEDVARGVIMAKKDEKRLREESMDLFTRQVSGEIPGVTTPLTLGELDRNVVAGEVNPHALSQAEQDRLMAYQEGQRPSVQLIAPESTPTVISPEAAAAQRKAELDAMLADSEKREEMTREQLLESYKLAGDNEDLGAKYTDEEKGKIRIAAFEETVNDPESKKTDDWSDIVSDANIEGLVRGGLTGDKINDPELKAKIEAEMAKQKAANPTATQPAQGEVYDPQGETTEARVERIWQERKSGNRDSLSAEDRKFYNENAQLFADKRKEKYGDGVGDWLKRQKDKLADVLSRDTLNPFVEENRNRWKDSVKKNWKKWVVGGAIGMVGSWLVRMNAPTAFLIGTSGLVAHELTTKVVGVSGNDRALTDRLLRFTSGHEKTHAVLEKLDKATPAFKNLVRGFLIGLIVKSGLDVGGHALNTWLNGSDASPDVGTSAQGNMPRADQWPNAPHNMSPVGGGTTAEDLVYQGLPEATKGVDFSHALAKPNSGGIFGTVKEYLIQHGVPEPNAALVADEAVKALPQGIKGVTDPKLLTNGMLDMSKIFRTPDLVKAAAESIKLGPDNLMGGAGTYVKSGAKDLFWKAVAAAK